MEYHHAVINGHRAVHAVSCWESFRNCCCKLEVSGKNRAGKERSRKLPGREGVGQEQEASWAKQWLAPGSHSCFLSSSFLLKLLGHNREATGIDLRTLIEKVEVHPKVSEDHEEASLTASSLHDVAMHSLPCMVNINYHMPKLQTSYYACCRKGYLSYMWIWLLAIYMRETNPVRWNPQKERSAQGFFWRQVAQLYCWG